jgi:o-succinylbenzoate---CoA ligase
MNQQTLQHLQFLKLSLPRPRIFVAARDTQAFLASFEAGVSAGCDLFLGNSDWADFEWQQALAIAQPDCLLVNGQIDDRTAIHGSPLPLINNQGLDQPPWIMIPTGGSSGQVRYAIHTWDTLTAAVKGFQQFFQVKTVHSFCVLPLHHVSGLMQFIRSTLSDGQFVQQCFKDLVAGELPAIDPTEFFISLVPTQLQRLLEHSHTCEWLRGFHTVLLGGAPPWPELVAQAREHQIRVALTYGMTETAALIAAVKPDRFLAGEDSGAKRLPHVEVRILTPDGNQQTHETGMIAIQATSLAIGYYPHPFEDKAANVFMTDDLGVLDAEHRLHVVGRNSQKLITGGENVFPVEVEAAIRATGLVHDVYVLGVPDRQWGQAITAIYVPDGLMLDLTQLKTALSTRLSRFKYPKHWLAVETIPRNAQGKVNLAQMTAFAQAQIVATPVANRTGDQATIDAIVDDDQYKHDGLRPVPDSALDYDH